MELVYHMQGMLIGLIGWAATALLTMSSTKLSALEQRAAMVCTWVTWMVPASGSLVYRGIITIDAAAIFCGVTTILLAVFASLGATSWKTRH